MSGAPQWLARRSPPPPPTLAARLQAVVAERGADGEPIPEALVAAGVELFERLLGDGAAKREAALDLLAADALVTYAFEAASDDVARLDERARAAMLQIAALVHDRR